MNLKTNLSWPLINLQESTLWAKQFGLTEITFIDPRFNHLENIELLGKANLPGPSTPIRLSIHPDRSGIVEFKSPQRALTPGANPRILRWRTACGFRHLFSFQIWPCFALST